MFKKIFLAAALSLLAAATAIAAGNDSKNPVVLMETSMGAIRIELFQKEAPVSVSNFLEYAKSGYYSGTIFHRVIPGFMAQGGGLTAELQPKPGTRPPIINEAGNGLKNDRGTVAMARTGEINSATSQFFINVSNNDFLNHRDEGTGFGYAVFGKVTEGMEVVDKIVSTPQEQKNRVFQNVPKTPVLIRSIKIQK